MNDTTINIIKALLDLANAATYPDHATRKGAQEITAICHSAERHLRELQAPPVEDKPENDDSEEIEHEDDK